MARTPNELQNDTDLRVAVGVIQSQVKDMKDTLGRVETKMDNNAYVHESKYADDRKSDALVYATKAEVKTLDKKYSPMLTLGISIISVIILGIVSAGLAFIFKGGLS